MMYIGIPQAVLIALLILNLGTAIAKDGEDKGKYSAGATFFDIAITLGILYWGGFFS